MAAEKLSPFAWLDCITQKKGDLMEDYGEKAYPAFMIIRGLSYFPDCVLYAAEVNAIPTIEPKMAYDYFMKAVKPGKRRSGSWGKRSASEDVKLVMDHYEYNQTKAEQALRLLTTEQIEQIRELETRGRDN